MNIKHPKLRGEWAEMRFMARAAEHGLQVSKPWGESASYDFVVEHGNRCSRVQVKSTMQKRGDGYPCKLRNGQQRPYEDDSFDFMAGYVISLDTWYIVPVSEAAGRNALFFSTKRRRTKYGKYKEAWHLLRGKPRATTIDRIEACSGELQCVAQLEAWM